MRNKYDVPLVLQKKGLLRNQHRLERKGILERTIEEATTIECLKFEIRNLEYLIKNPK